MNLPSHSVDSTHWLSDVLNQHAEPAQAYRLCLTPELAKMFLAHMRVNRPVKAKNIQHFRRMLRHGHLVYTGQPLIFNQHAQMLDGQHRCLAVIAENMPIDVLIVLDIADTAFRFLDQGAKRTASDQLENVPNRATIAAALSWLWAEENGLLGPSAKAVGSLPASEAMAMFDRYRYIEEHCSVAGSCRDLLPPGLAVYSSLRASRHDPDKSAAFFASLSRGVNLSPGHPILLLRERLQRNRIAKARLPSFELLALLIKAWSRYVAGGPLRTLRWRSIDTDRAQGEPFPSWPGRPLERSK